MSPTAGLVAKRVLPNPNKQQEECYFALDMCDSFYCRHAHL